MAGRGDLQEAHKIDTTHIYTLRMGRWQKMFRPINPDRWFSGVSLAESFAEGYAKRHNVDVGLICCADGGTSLQQWMPGEALFEHAVCQAKLACRTSQIAGVLWHQGEADSHAPNYDTYQQRFEIMMQALRKELGLQDVPFLLGGLGDFLELYPIPGYIHVNAALQNIARDNEMTEFVSAEGLTAKPDNLHFNSASLYEFGLRYLDVFESMEKAAIADKTIKEDLQRTEMELL